MGLFFCMRPIVQYLAIGKLAAYFILSIRVRGTLSELQHRNCTSYILLWIWNNHLHTYKQTKRSFSNFDTHNLRFTKVERVGNVMVAQGL